MSAPNSKQDWFEGYVEYTYGDKIEIDSEIRREFVKEFKKSTRDRLAKYGESVRKKVEAKISILPF